MNLTALQFPYVTTKRCGDEEAAANRYGRNVVVNLNSTFGPNDHDSSEFGAFCIRLAMGLNIYFCAAKATREHGFRSRPLAETLADTHAYWLGKTPSLARSA